MSSPYAKSLCQKGPLHIIPEISEESFSRQFSNTSKPYLISAAGPVQQVEEKPDVRVLNQMFSETAENPSNDVKSISRHPAPQTASSLSLKRKRARETAELKKLLCQDDGEGLADREIIELQMLAIVKLQRDNMLLSNRNQSQDRKRVRFLREMEEHGKFLTHQAQTELDKE